MSNCVEIKRQDVWFGAEEIDIPKFRELVDRVNLLPQPPDGLKDRDGYFAWWFLSSNVEFGLAGLVIHFGRGRSSHTWRDLQGTLMVLGQFMLKPKKHVFRIADELDGFESWGWCKVGWDENGKVILD